MDEQLADPETYKDSGKIRELTTRKSELEGKLEATFDAWMSAQSELDEAMSQFEA